MDILDKPSRTGKTRADMDKAIVAACAAMAGEAVQRHYIPPGRRQKLRTLARHHFRGAVDTGKLSGRGRIRKIGRNAPCPCGSGRKYKKCHGTR